MTANFQSLNWKFKVWSFSAAFLISQNENPTDYCHCHSYNSVKATKQSKDLPLLRDYVFLVKQNLHSTICLKNSRNDTTFSSGCTLIKPLRKSLARIIFGKCLECHLKITLVRRHRALSFSESVQTIFKWPTVEVRFICRLVYLFNQKRFEAYPTRFKEITFGKKFI